MTPKLEFPALLFYFGHDFLTTLKMQIFQFLMVIEVHLSGKNCSFLNADQSPKWVKKDLLPFYCLGMAFSGE